MRSNKLATILSILLAASAVTPAYADVVSPSIKDRGEEYTTEKCNSAYFGSGTGGRMTEASQLRIECDFALQERDFKTALKKAQKACQLDPSYAEGHLLLARAMTGCIYQNQGAVDEKMLHEALREWKIIRIHDADISDQFEASSNLKKLGMISRGLEKERERKKKEEELRKEAELAQAKKDGTLTTADTHQNKIAEKKRKRFGIFPM